MQLYTPSDAAQEVLDAVRALCQADTRTACYWLDVRMNRYSYTVKHVHSDGAVTGVVYEVNRWNEAPHTRPRRAVGSFRVETDGYIVAWPHIGAMRINHWLVVLRRERREVAALLEVIK